MAAIKLEGSWDEGYALDLYTLSSEFLGYDLTNKPLFNNEYSETGKLLNELKYWKKQSRAQDLADKAFEAISKNKLPFEHIGSILPVPPTTERVFQPVFEVAQLLARKLCVSCCNNVLLKMNIAEAKAGHHESVKIKKIKCSNCKHNVLLFDDVYKTGSTLEACTQALRADTNIDKIYVLTLTKTRT